jgi:quercetin dioxygenase-like cupin family protein
MNAPAASPLVRAAEGAEERWFFGGGIHRWLVRAEETNGAFFLHEEVLTAGKATPLHSHPADETMFVLEGSIRVHIDGDEREVTAGGVAVAPREVPHAFLVTGEPTRLLCLHTPGACQGFYLGASGPADTTDQVIDFDRVMASGRANGGFTFLGPPPFADRAVSSA